MGPEDTKVLGQVKLREVIFEGLVVVVRVVVDVWLRFPEVMGFVGFWKSI